MQPLQLIVIGGSAGSLPVLQSILRSLPDNFSIPVIIVIHRQRNVSSELSRILNSSSRKKKILEPDDKEPIRECCIYLAPQNYHLLIEEDKTISLDYSELVQFSRPSIDVTFDSAAKIYKSTLAAILLTGANNDGTKGLLSVVNEGGLAIAQDPKTAEYPVMPLSAIEKVEEIQVLKPHEIIEFLKAL